MNLSAIKHYLKVHHRATLTDLVNHFKTEVHTLQPMLSHWERKGKVRHIHISGCSKGCCQSGALDIYEWMETETIQ